MLIVGASETGKMIMQSVAARPHLGYVIVGLMDRRDWERAPHSGRFQRLGIVNELTDIIARNRIDEVVFALPGSAHEDACSVVTLCAESGAALQFVPDMFCLNLSRVQMDDIAGSPFLNVPEKPTRVAERVVKRILDFATGVIVLSLSLQILAALALFIKLDSHGPIFIREVPVGKHGKRFTCFKLRTMRKNADQLLAALPEQNEAEGHIFKARNDPLLTRVGRFLRKLSLDELLHVTTSGMTDLC